MDLMKEGLGVPSRAVIGTRIDATNYEHACEVIGRWASERRSTYTCVTNVHAVMESHDRPDVDQAHANSDLCVPDGMPIVWALRKMGVRDAQQVRGTDLTLRLLAEAESRGLVVGFYGGSPPTLDLLIDRLARDLPGLKVGYAHSPPYRELSPEERAFDFQRMNGAGVQLLLVGLGCPKQELWMHSMRGHIHASMVGVGAAFDFLAGEKSQAPDILREAGLEWAFRLAQEPRRLWRRYARNNPRFALKLGRQLLSERPR